MTRDFVNPEKPWPHIQRLAAAAADSGFVLVPRSAASVPATLGPEGAAPLLISIPASQPFLVSNFCLVLHP